MGNISVSTGTKPISVRLMEDKYVCLPAFQSNVLIVKIAYVVIVPTRTPIALLPFLKIAPTNSKSTPHP